ncbi:hypothetical protein [Sphingomonas sp.]|uniref:hypothetical protein n=1 Tax=Sphingomonas sp. TaxID=28214 RepID=UPI0025D0070C|nr:hypothetical protein [Sphingomonas sp.]
MRYAAGAEASNIVMIGFGVTMLLGIIVLTISAIWRISKGEVKLRPWLAVKPALFIFFGTMALRFLAWAVFPGLERDLTGAVIHSLIFALAYSLYSTAYRKTA